MLEEINSDFVLEDSEIIKRSVESSKTRNTRHMLFSAQSGEVAFVSVDLIENIESLILYELYVPTKYRGKGIGKKVLKELSRFALQEGYSKIDAYPKPINNHFSEQKLIQWYLNYGFLPKKDQTGEYQYKIDT